MAHGIDTMKLLDQWMPRLELLLSAASHQGRYQVHKVYACATILTHDEEAIMGVSFNTPAFSVTQDILDWQPEQDEDINEGDVYHHLVQMSAAPSRSSMGSADNHLYSILSAERHVTSAQARTFADRAEKRPASSFYRDSFRLSTLDIYNADFEGYHIGATDMEVLNVIKARKVPSAWWELFLFDESPQLIWERPEERCAVLWQVQVDILDMHNPKPAARPRKRRLYGTFSQIDSHGGCGEATSSRHLDPDSAAKQFKGVRWRSQRKRYIAESRLSNSHQSKNKISFGDFKSAREAARAIDAAFYYYGMRDKVNFTDSPQLLSTRPVPDGLSEADMLSLVKEQAKWLATFDSVLPSSPPSATASTAPLTLNPGLSAGFAAISDSGNLPPLSDISSVLSSYGSVGGTDNFAFQLSPSSVDAMAGSSISKGWPDRTTLEPWIDVASADHCIDVIGNEFGELGRSTIQMVCRVDDAINGADPFTVHFTDRWNGSESFPTWKAALETVMEQPARDEIQSVSGDLLCVSSSPGPNLFEAQSPPGFQDDVADQLLQQQLIGSEDAGNEQPMRHLASPSWMQVVSFPSISASEQDLDLRSRT